MATGLRARPIRRDAGDVHAGRDDHAVLRDLPREAHVLVHLLVGTGGPEGTRALLSEARRPHEVGKRHRA